jgi:hypothetical protein
VETGEREKKGSQRVIVRISVRHEDWVVQGIT